MTATGSPGTSASSKGTGRRPSPWLGGLLVALLVLAATLVVAFALPERFESTAILEVVRADAAESADKPNGEATLAELRKVLQEAKWLGDMAGEAGAADGSPPVVAEQVRAAIDITARSPRTFGVTFRAATAEAATSGCSKLSEAIVAHFGTRVRTESGVLDQRTRELAEFVTLHPDLLSEVEAPASPPPSPAPSPEPARKAEESRPRADTAVAVLRQEKARLEAELARVQAEQGPAGGRVNPYDDPHPSREAEGLKKRIGEVRAAILARQRALARSEEQKAKEAAAPVVTPAPPPPRVDEALVEEWKRLVRAVADAQHDAAAATTADTTGYIARIVESASMPKVPADSHRTLLRIGGAFLGVLLGLVWALVQSARRAAEAVEPSASSRRAPAVEPMASVAPAPAYVGGSIEPSAPPPNLWPERLSPRSSDPPADPALREDVARVRIPRAPALPSIAGEPAEPVTDALATRIRPQPTVVVSGSSRPPPPPSIAARQAREELAPDTQRLGTREASPDTGPSSRRSDTSYSYVDRSRREARTASDRPVPAAPTAPARRSRTPAQERMSAQTMTFDRIDLDRMGRKGDGRQPEVTSSYPPAPLASPPPPAPDGDRRSTRPPARAPSDRPRSQPPPRRSQSSRPDVEQPAASMPVRDVTEERKVTPPTVPAWTRPTPPGAIVPHQGSTALASPRPPPEENTVETRSAPPSWRMGPALSQVSPDDELLGLRDQVSDLADVRPIVVAVVGDADAMPRKSRISARLAALLAADGTRRVLLLESNFDYPAVHEMMAIDMPPGAGFSQQLRARAKSGRHRAWTAIRCTQSLFVLAEGFVRSPGIMLSREYAEAISELRRYFDVIVLDGPAAGGGAEGQALDAVSDGAVVVVSSRQSLADGLDRASRWFRKKDLMAAVPLDAPAPPSSAIVKAQG